MLGFLLPSILSGYNTKKKKNRDILFISLNNPFNTERLKNMPRESQEWQGRSCSLSRRNFVKLARFPAFQFITSDTPDSRSNLIKAFLPVVAFLPRIKGTPSYWLVITSIR